MKQIRCFLLPSECDLVSVGPQVVVIDVLRASTTICAALANGANSVQPFPDVASTRKFADEPADDVLTGGERQGEKLPGFDLGNSPIEYSQDRVGGRRIAFTTTNGTRAMEKCRAAETVVIGAFCNRGAVAEYLSPFNELDLICAGTDGRISIEDCAFAGSLVDFFVGDAGDHLGENESYCLQRWNEFRREPTDFLKSGDGGKNLMRLGRQADIEFAARLDTFSLVPRLKIDSWKIEPA